MFSPSSPQSEFALRRLHDLAADLASIYNTNKDLAIAYMDKYTQECSTHQAQIGLSQDVLGNECVARVHKTLLSHSIKSWRLIHVESDYYSWPLQKRAFRLNCPSIQHLCKTIIFENTKYRPRTGIDELDPRYSQYYCVVVQYTTKLDNTKLNNFVRGLLDPRLPSGHYNLRLTSEEQCLQLTGFLNGGVSPIGLLKSNVPVIVSSEMTLLQPKLAVIGGGHVDWKLVIGIDELMVITKCMTADLI